MEWNKRKLGSEKEQMVCEYLMQHGYEILECNYQVRCGEIDIIAKEQEYLVFIEVKYRRFATSGYAAEAVNYRKIRKIGRVVLFYLNAHAIPDNQAIRFDVVAVDGDRIEVIKNAFEYMGH